MFHNSITQNLLIHVNIIKICRVHKELQIVMFLTELAVKRINEYFYALSHGCIFLLLVVKPRLIHIFVELFKNLSAFRVIIKLCYFIYNDVSKPIISQCLRNLKSEYAWLFTYRAISLNIISERIYRTVL